MTDQASLGRDNWSNFAKWHLLFDELCNRAGYFDDASLASAYCAAANGKGQKQFETSMRNLNNWRSGRHIPQQRNLKVLARLLDIGNDPRLQRQWDELYRHARALEESGSIPPAEATQVMHIAAPSVVPAAGVTVRKWSMAQAAAIGALLFCIGAVTGSAVTASGWRPWGGPADNAPIIPFEPRVSMKLGEERNIYAVRGDCGKLPPEWADVSAGLPVARTGSFSDGGLARRFSKFCQGLTPARGIRFTATGAGMEEFEIQGDFFKMTVTE